jgi:hypothetical protein
MLGNKLCRISLIPQLQRYCGYRYTSGIGGSWVDLIDVRHSLDSAMEPLHPREVATKELGPAKADEKFFDKATYKGQGRVCHVWLSR